MLPYTTELYIELYVYISVPYLTKFCILPVRKVRLFVHVHCTVGVKYSFAALEPKWVESTRTHSKHVGTAVQFAMNDLSASVAESLKKTLNS